MGVTAVVNQKGGVGKTTVTLGLAAAIADLGGRVLVVDMDPQANATTGLGVWDAKATIDQSLATETPGSIGPIVRPSSWVVGAGGAVDVAPSSPGLSQCEHQLATDAIGGQDRLAGALAGVADRYDLVLIDCPPSLGLLTVNALFAADEVVIVAEPAAWSADGVDQILRNVARIAGRRNGRPEVAGIVINRLGRTRDAAHWHEHLVETHPDLVLDPPVRLRAAVAEASAQCLPITELARSGAAESAEEFRQLIRLLLPALFGRVVESSNGSGPASGDDGSGGTMLGADGADPDPQGERGRPQEVGRPTGTRETADGQVRPEAAETNAW